jgi:hypothetical protein
MPDGSWPSPGGAGGRTTPPFGHPSLKEGNVSGSLTSAGRRCILLRQSLAGSMCRSGGAGERGTPRSRQPPRPPSRTSTPCRRTTSHHPRQPPRPPKPILHALPKSNAPSLPQTASVPRHSPPLRRGGRRPGWSARAAAGRAPTPQPPVPQPLATKMHFRAYIWYNICKKIVLLRVFC